MIFTNFSKMAKKPKNLAFWGKEWKFGTKLKFCRFLNWYCSHMDQDNWMQFFSRITGGKGLKVLKISDDCCNLKLCKKWSKSKEKLGMSKIWQPCSFIQLFFLYQSNELLTFLSYCVIMGYQYLKIAKLYHVYFLRY